MSFGSPAENYAEAALELNRLLIKHPSGTYFLRMEGNTMEKEGIFDGDILIVDRALDAGNNKIIIGELNNSLTIRKFLIKDGKNYLTNGDTPPQLIKPSDNFSLWGVVTYTIRSFDK